jgi:hypothetical protein
MRALRLSGYKIEIKREPEDVEEEVNKTAEVEELLENVINIKEVISTGKP